MADNKKSNLGIDSIFGNKTKIDFDAINKTSSTLDNIGKIPIDKIKPNPRQPRLRFKVEDLNLLASSISKQGLLNPISVTKDGDDFILTQGERRFRAAKILGWETIPATIETDNSESRKARAGLAENIIRKNLSPIEEAKAYRNLIEKDKMTHDMIAKEYGISRSAVSNKIRLLNLPVEVQTLVTEERLKEGHARQLLALNTIEEIIKKANEIIENNITVRDLETSKKSPASPRKRKQKFNIAIKKELLKKNRFNTKITLGSDKISFTFETQEDMKRFLKNLGFID